MKTGLGIAALLALGAASVRAIDCDSVFLASPLADAGDWSRQVAVADFNDDGKADVVSFNSHYTNQSVAVLLGNGDGTLQAPVITTIDADSMVVGDFNGDGKADLVFASPSSGSTLLGNGDGSFGDPIPLPQGAPGWSLTAGYFDADSNLDLAGDGVTVLLGNGDGTFGSPVTYPASGSFGPVAAGDIDGDGKVDVVNAGPNLVSVLPGAGDGTFGAPTSTVVGQALSNLQVADVDGDGHADVVLISDEQIAVLFGFGDFTFEAARIYAAGPQTVGVTTADLQGDGVDLDLVATADDGNFGSPGRVEVLRNLGDRAFAASLESLSPSGPTPPVSGDFDGNGKIDVVAGSLGASAVVAMMNLGDGTLAAPRPGDAGGSVHALADFNEDGILDLLAGAGVALGEVDATFSPGPLSPDFFIASAAGVADFNGDGHLDVVGVRWAQFGPFDFVFFAGLGDATFEAPTFVPLPGPATPASAVVITDFDGDGKPDVAFSHSQGSSGNGQITVLRGDGQGGFLLTAAMSVNNSLIAGLVASDFDGGGLPDLAAAGGDALGGGIELLVLRGRGDGTFDLPLEQPLDGFAAAALSLGAFRQPDRDDLVLSLGDQTVLLKDNGDLTFADPEVIADGRADATAAADMDGDGELDLIVTAFEAQFFLKGLGSGAFVAPVGYPHAGYGAPILIGDVDGNQAPDIIAGGLYLDFSILLNARLGASVLPASAVTGSATQLHARAGGLPPLTYQWRRNGVDLSDGGPISGSQTPTLTIDPVAFGDAGPYDVVVTGACGTVTSNAAALSVEFADVPLTSLFHDDILAIATAGISSGCGGGNYCPTAPVRRDQMAVFLLRAEHGSAYAPPSCTGVFSDVPCPGPFTDWVEQLAAEGVTSGCGTGVYCPSQSVTRAQMAVFLLKTSEGSGYTPPPATGIFGDVPVGSFAADFVEDLYGRGVTGGCSALPLLYCPGSTVLREQMATFLARTFFP